MSNIEQGLKKVEGFWFPKSIFDIRAAGSIRSFQKSTFPVRNSNFKPQVLNDPSKNRHSLFEIRYSSAQAASSNFHTTLGHSTVSMGGRGFQETLTRGAEWVATGKVTFPAVSAKDLPADKVATGTE